MALILNNFTRCDLLLNFTWNASFSVAKLKVCDIVWRFADFSQTFSWITSLTVTYLKIFEITMKVCAFLCDLLPNFFLNHFTHCDLPGDLWYCNEGLSISLWPSPQLSPKSLHSLWPTWRSVILQWRFVYFSVTFSRTFSWNAPLSDWNCAVLK